MRQTPGLNKHLHIVALMSAMVLSFLVPPPPMTMANEAEEDYPLNLPPWSTIIGNQWTTGKDEAVELSLFSMRMGLIPEGSKVYLDLQKAIEFAFDRNLAIRTERYNTGIAETEIQKAEGSFDIYLTSTLSHGFSRTAVYSATQNRTDLFLRTDTSLADIGLRKLLKTGSLVELKLDLTRYSSTSDWLVLKPSYNANMNLSLAQPLLKNGGMVFQTAPILIAEKLHLMSQDRWEAFVADTLVSVVLAYWDLVFAFQNHEVRVESLNLAKEMLRTSEIRVKLGSLAPIDLLQSKTGVAMREEEVIGAKGLLQTAQDLLKELLRLEQAPIYSSVQLIPTETPSEPPPQEESTLDDAITQALKNRPEYWAARRDLETKKLQSKMAENQLLPTLDLTGGVGLNGLGGNPVGISDEQREFLKLNFPAIYILIPEKSPWGGGWKRSFEELFSNDTYQWNIGARFEFPLENTTAKAGFRQAKMDEYKSQWAIRNLEQKIIVEVKETWRALQLNRQKILTSVATQHLAQQQLEAEQKRLSLGLSTNYQVLQMEEDLRNAKINTLMANTEYWKAKARYHKAAGILLEKRSIPIDQMAP